MDDPTIFTTINALSDTSQLEAIGKELTAAQMLLIIDAASHKTIPENKILALLVGLSNDVFRQVLHNAGPAQLGFLKLEGVTEPIQHHLTLLAGTTEAQDILIGTNLMMIDHDIQELDLANVGRKEIMQILKQLEIKKEYYLNTISLASKALTIAWNTNRLDLIEQFTHIKERCLSSLHDFIGSPSKEDCPATGIYGNLDQKLASVFANNHQLKDSDPSTEALAVFSIWYLRDYWAIGLLPLIKRQEDLELNTEDESAKRDHRQALFTTVQENLNRLGIGTVGDLKKAEIYSKKLLADYISVYRSKILTNS